MRRLVSFVAFHVLLAVAAAAGGEQEVAPASRDQGEAPSQTPAEAPAEPVKEGPLPILYLPDENGKPVPTLVGWTYDDFWELYQRAGAQEQGDQPPRYILRSMSATGDAKADYAELAVRFEVWTRDERWCRVPLGLEQALFLSEPVQYKGSGECFLHLDEGSKGYVAWIRGAADEQHQLTLKVWVPLTTVGDETRLSLSAPPDTGSELKLTVPVTGAVGEVSERAKLWPSSPSGGETTEFVARWTGGDLEIKWHGPDTRPSGIRPVLDAEGSVVAKIDRRNVVTEANLRVRGTGGPFDRFTVSLPKGAELVPGNAPGYSVTPLAGSERPGDEPLVEVRRDRKLPEPMEVKLTVRQSREAAGRAGWFELGGFEVVDAVQQWGHVAVTAVGDRPVRCVTGRGIRQIDELPDKLEQELQDQHIVARFEYFSQPFSLNAGVLDIKTRVGVEPKYRILVDEGQVRLEADLKYTVRGAKVFSLDVVLPDWQLDEVGPDNLVAVPSLGHGNALPNGQGGQAGRSEVVSIPLLQPSMGEIAIWIRAHREIQPGDSSFSVALPQPRADFLTPAEVEVVPAENVELAPKVKSIVGLARQQVALPRQLSYRAEAAEAVFAADFKIHAQQIKVNVASEVSLVRGKEGVRQTLVYDVAYEPLEKLTLEVPRHLAALEQLEIVLDGQPLEPVVPADQLDDSDASKPARMQIALPAARIGECRLEIRYPIVMEELLPEGSIICPVPLVMPGEGELSSNELFVAVPQGVGVQYQTAEGPWRVSEDSPGRSERRTGLHLSADERSGRVVLRVHQEDQGATEVEFAWVATCLTHSGRHERAVFRFTSGQRELELILPAGADFRQMELLLGPEKVEDRKSIRVQPTPDGRLVVPLPDHPADEPLWLEAWYAFSGPRPAPGRLSMELPRLGGEVWVRRTYWELLLPQNEHVIVGPHGFTPEWQWSWNGTFFGRKPLVDQAQLEEWSGASRQTDLPTTASRYLFSSLETVKRCDLRTANRWVIVFVASSVVLGAGLLLIYVRPIRHPAVLLVVAIVVLAGAVSYPGPALLASQAASLGLALALLGGLLHRTVGRAARPAVGREPSSSVYERRSTQAQYRPPVAADPASTQTVPAEMPIRTRDSEP